MIIFKVCRKKYLTLKQFILTLQHLTGLKIASRINACFLLLYNQIFLSFMDSHAFVLFAEFVYYIKHLSYNLSAITFSYTFAINSLKDYL